MKVLSRIDGSVCGAILSTRPSTTRAAVSCLPNLRDDHRPPRAPVSQCRLHDGGDVPTRSSHCPRTASWLLSTFLPAPSKRPRPATYNTSHGYSRARLQRYSHATAAAAAVSPTDDHVVIRQKEDLLDYVDSTDAGTVQEHLDLIKDPFRNRYAQPEPPKVYVSGRNESVQYPSFEQALQGNQSLLGPIAHLGSLVGTRKACPHSDRVTLDQVHDAYMTLPEPRMLHVPARTRHKLLIIFGRQCKKNTQAMLRYFSYIGDVKDCGLVLQRREWNFALSLAAQYVGTISVTEMEDALQLWKEMERDASVQGNDITFNILFDAASKSGNFPLAERIYKEMESRNIPFTRFHHVSLIHFFGLKQDPDGVRAAYKEMVEAGEMVDTTVLNCVISSFFKCREVESAMRVYEHMKGIQTKADGFSSKSHHAENATDVLKRLTKISKTCPEFRPKLQELAPTAPDGRTYRTLFEHFAVKTGDFNTVAMLLEDMRTFDVVVNGGIFLVLFKAFKKHGGYVGTDWTADRLSTVLVALLEDLDDGVKGLYLDTWLMMWALRAFGQCTSKEVVLEVYEEFRSRWRLVEDKAQFMDAYLNNLLAGKDGAVHRERFATQMTTRATRK